MRHCGTHPENRARMGVDPFNAQNLALKPASSDIPSFEKAASGPAASAKKDFMKKEIRLFRRYLRTIPFHDVEYLPVICSHTFAAARA